MVLVCGISDKIGLICYDVIFAEYEKKWTDSVSAARLRVVANFFLVEVCCCCCGMFRILRIETLGN